MDTEYLAHHGIKGQKWGVRRFQNPDGTRTALGKSRNSIVKNRLKSSFEKRAEAKAIRKEASAAEKHAQLRSHVVSHPKDLYKNKDKFTHSEIEGIIKDIEFDRKIKDVRSEEIKRGLTAYGLLKESTVTTAQMLKNAKDIYNIFVDVNNARIDAGKSSGKKMVRLGGDNNKSDNNSNSSNQSSSQPSNSEKPKSSSKPAESKAPVGDKTEPTTHGVKAKKWETRRVFDTPMSVLMPDGDYWIQW
jgi:hypothetical protein